MCLIVQPGNGMKSEKGPAVHYFPEILVVFEKIEVIKRKGKTPIFHRIRAGRLKKGIVIEL
jgi:hypothetical protein